MSLNMSDIVPGVKHENALRHQPMEKYLRFFIEQFGSVPICI